MFTPALNNFNFIKFKSSSYFLLSRTLTDWYNLVLRAFPFRNMDAKMKLSHVDLENLAVGSRPFSITLTNKLHLNRTPPKRKSRKFLNRSEFTSNCESKNPTKFGMDSINRICFILLSVRAVTMAASGLALEIISQWVFTWWAPGFQEFRKGLKDTKKKSCLHFIAHIYHDFHDRLC